MPLGGARVPAQYAKMPWFWLFRILGLDGQCSPHQLKKGRPVPLSRRKRLSAPP
jgi:hypothetical protein